MAGSCTATVRASATGKMVNIPYRFWGLEIGGTYRVVLNKTIPPHPQCPPYSFDAKLGKSGSSARVTIPACLTSINIGDFVEIWVGRPEDYGQPGEVHGRGYCKKERAEFLEEQVNLLYGHSREQVHDERSA